MNNFSNYFRGALIFVPAVSLLSANFYFLMLSSKLQFISLNAFTLQDHFDKAVDLLIVVFVAMLLGLGSVYLSALDADESADEQKTSWLSTALSFWMRIATLRRLYLFTFFFGVYSFFLMDVGALGMSILWIGMSLFAFVRKLAERFNSHHFKKDGEIPHAIVFFSYFTLVGVIGTICMNLDLSISHAKKQYFEDQNTRIVDKFSFGYLVIHEDRFGIADDQLNIIIQGDNVDPIVQSIACANGWRLVCFGAQDLRDRNNSRQDGSITERD